jgi:hypothetical protein
MPFLHGTEYALPSCQPRVTATESQLSPLAFGMVNVVHRRQIDLPVELTSIKT